MMPASIKLELYDVKDNLDIEEVATTLRTFLNTVKGLEDAKGKVVVKVPGFECRLKIEDPVKTKKE